MDILSLYDRYQLTDWKQHLYSDRHRVTDICYIPKEEQRKSSVN